MNSTIATKTAELLFSINAISLRPKKPFRFTSGLLSPIYIDNRLIITYPKVRKTICRFYLKIIRERIGLRNIDLLSGTSTAAIPYAAFIAQRLNLPMVYVRSSNKTHGKGNKIEGIVKKGQKTLILEDHITTGGSMMGNVNAIRKAGGIVKNAIASTTYLLPKASQTFKKSKIKVLTLTDIKLIVKIAIDKKIIQAKDKDMILEWAKDPKKWGKRYKFE